MQWNVDPRTYTLECGLRHERKEFKLLIQAMLSWASCDRAPAFVQEFVDSNPALPKVYGSIRSNVFASLFTATKVLP